MAYVMDRCDTWRSGNSILFYSSTSVEFPSHCTLSRPAARLPSVAASLFRSISGNSSLLSCFCLLLPCARLGSLSFWELSLRPFFCSLLRSVPMETIMSATLPARTVNLTIRDTDITMQVTTTIIWKTRTSRLLSRSQRRRHRRLSCPLSLYHPCRGVR
jgi:hypothetical protein